MNSIGRHKIMANVVCLPKVHVQISCLLWQQVPRGKQNNLIFLLNRALSVSANAHAQLLITHPTARYVCAPHGRNNW